MRQGKTLTQLAEELDRQKDVKRDFIVPTGELMYDDSIDSLVFDSKTYKVNDTAHEQIGQRLQIPKRYYDRLREPEHRHLLRKNLNYWFESKPEKRMVRTLDGTARAFLSNRYRPLDNLDLAEVVIPKIMEMGCNVVSCELTERKMYIKIITDRIEEEISKGDIVQSGLVISNSEVGCGSIRVEPMIYRLVCTNGMISADYSMKKYHIGRGNESGEFFKDATRQADDKAFFMKVNDLIDATMDREGFSQIVEKMRTAQGQKIEKNPEKVVEIVQKQTNINDEERGSVLLHLCQGADMSRYGLVNAITRTAQDSPSYDRATELERLGGEMLNISSREWQTIAN